MSNNNSIYLDTTYINSALLSAKTAYSKLINSKINDTIDRIIKSNEAKQFKNYSILVNIKQKINDIYIDANSIVSLLNNLDKTSSDITKNINFNFQFCNNNINQQVVKTNSVDNHNNLPLPTDFEYNEIKIEGFTPQGYTVIDDMAVISAYQKGNKSRLYLYDINSKQFEGYIELLNDAHVGGCTFDEDDNFLFVTDHNGKICIYDWQEIKKGIDILKINHQPFRVSMDSNIFKASTINTKIDINEYVNSYDASSCYYYNGSLYVTTYSQSGYLIKYDLSNLKEYNIRKNNNYLKDTAAVVPYKIEGTVISDNLPGAVQGIACYSQNGHEYIVFAQSAIGIKSNLIKYEVVNDKLIKIGSYNIDQSGLEGIKIDKAGNLSGIFEYEEQKTLNVNVNDINKNYIDSLNKIHYEPHYSPLLNVSLRTEGAIWNVKNNHNRKEDE